MKKYSRKLQRCELVSMDYALREFGTDQSDEPFGLAVYEHKEFYVDIEEWFWFKTEQERSDYIKQNKLVIIDDLK